MKNLMIAILCGGLMSACHGIELADTGARVTARDGEPPEQFVQSCTDSNECKLVPPVCCPCSAGSAVVAVHVDQAQPYQDWKCEEVMTCPECSDEPPAHLVATCEAGECRVLDVLTVDAIAGCETDEQCTIGWADCCDCVGDTVIAVSDIEAYDRAVCDAVSCDFCGVTDSPREYPPGTVAMCSAGSCQVATMPPHDGDATE